MVLVFYYCYVFRYQCPSGISEARRPSTRAGPARGQNGRCQSHHREPAHSLYGIYGYYYLLLLLLLYHILLSGELWTVPRDQKTVHTGSCSDSHYYYD